MILSLASFSAYSIFLTILYLSLACLLHNAEMLTAYQSSLHGKDKGDSVLKQEKDSDADVLCFFDTRISLQQFITQILC